MTSLRREIKENGGELKVIKNTLIRRAVEDFEYNDDLKNKFTGPTAIAFSYGDPVSIAKSLIKIADSSKRMEVASGLLANKVLSEKEVNALSKLPSRDELIAKTVRTIAAPLTSFVNVLAAVPRNFVNVLTAIKDNKDN